MEQANPEVKLALAVERAMRRAAGPLRTALAAATRVVAEEPATAALLAGPDPLSLLNALLEAPAEAAARERARRSGRSLAPAGTTTPGRPRLRSVGGGDGTAASPRPPEARAEPRSPSLAGTRPLDPLLRPAIAERRAELRRSVTAPMVPAASEPPPSRQQAPTLPTGAAPPQRHGTAAASEALAAAPHALATLAARAATAAAAALARAAEAAAATAQDASSPLARAGAEGTALTGGGSLGPVTQLPASPSAASPLAPILTPPAGMPRPVTALASAPVAAAPIAPARARPATLTLTDDPLTEAAWRNGVDLSWP
ncbi:hypothetical protein GI374_12090 [Paracoccus sp. S-4012]|uniref:hypothetical protein n=1 Tax=Paracoccus sp. S-4012 TaxID=2665648 RepID=UPI0012AFE5FA|nr:hypothetical protein [Paracoccus sp. S-4012]MRX51175.1 hypothetical protein [Paracoccus sp. S-4012]